MIAALEPDAALGNGGLGRLAACFMESMATVDVPAYGYGIRYVNGMFRQEITDGWQVELPETWLDHGNPWEFERRERAFEVGFGGSVESITAKDGRLERHVWKPAERVLAVAYDTPVVGWRGNRVNTLRLWSAMPIDPILLDAFNAGDHIGALRREQQGRRAVARALSGRLARRPARNCACGRNISSPSASLQDILQRHLQQYGDLLSLPDKAAIQLNDTHPAVAVAELMRLLMDVHGIDFDEAWEHHQAHLRLHQPHAAAGSAGELAGAAVRAAAAAPHADHLRDQRRGAARGARRRQVRRRRRSARISLIDEGGERRVRMGNLAFVGSHSINGVSALHTELMKETVFADLHRLYPDRINNKTNGITPRRWLIQCNPGLTDADRARRSATASSTTSTR